VCMCVLCRMSGDDQSMYRYRMDHRERGQLIIINNKTFQRQTRMEERSGTDVDAESLRADFTQLGFNVRVEHNQTAKQMENLMVDGNVSASNVVNLTSHSLHLLVFSMR